MKKLIIILLFLSPFLMRAQNFDNKESKFSTATINKLEFDEFYDYFIITFKSNDGNEFDVIDFYNLGYQLMNCSEENYPFSCRLKEEFKGRVYKIEYKNLTNEDFYYDAMEDIGGKYLFSIKKL